MRGLEIFASAASLIMICISCKKNYDCTCETSYQGIELGQTIYSIDKSSEASAESDCAIYETETQIDYDSIYIGTLTVCSLSLKQ